MHNSLHFAGVGLVICVAQNLSLGNPPEGPDIEGLHAIVAAERDGRTMDEASFHGATVRFEGGKFVASSAEGREFMTADYSLDHTKTPCAISLKMTSGYDKDKEYRGIVERKDNAIHIVLAFPGAVGPTEFKTKQNQLMYTLRVGK